MVLPDNHALELLVFPLPGTQLSPSNPAAPALNQVLAACQDRPAIIPSVISQVIAGLEAF